MPRLDLLTDADLPTGLGQLDLVALLGQGTSGRVYRAETRGVGGLPRVVAVTVVRPPRHADDPWGPGLADVHRARMLKHKGIVQVFSAGEREGLPFAVTELVEGAPLPELVEAGGALPPRNALDVGIQVAAALGAAHGVHPSAEAPILVHRDLRPSRVMVGADGVVKVRGFGLAEYTAPGSADLGRLAFASPELIGGKPAGPDSDQFSLGAILAWSLLASAPFPIPNGVSAALRVAAIVSSASTGALAKQLDRLAPGLGQVIQRMVAPEPRDRFATVTDAEAALRELRGALPRGERLGSLVTRHFGPDLGELTVAGPAPRPLLNKPSPLPRPAPPASAQPPPAAARPAALPAAPPAALRPSAPAAARPAPPPPAASSEPPYRPAGAPTRPPIPVPGRPLRTAPRSSAPPDEIPTNPGRPEADLESLDVLPVVGSDAAVSDVELEPTQRAIPPKRAAPPKRSGPAPISPSGLPLAGHGSSMSLRSDPSVSSPRVPRTVAPPQPIAPTPPPPAPGSPPPPVVPSSAGARKARRRAGPVRWLVRIFAVLTILGALAFIGLRLLLYPAADPASVVDTVEVPPPDEPGEAGPDTTGVAAATLAKGRDVGKGGDVAVPEAWVPEGVPAVAAPTPSPTPTPTPERGSRGGIDPIEPVVSPTPRREEPERTPAPSTLPPGSVTLAIDHRPIAAGDAGASDLLSVRLDGPPDSAVVLFSGPAGGPYSQSALRGKPGGRWEGWITFAGTPGGRFEYWVVAEHSAAERSASSGSRSAPHVVELR